MITVSNDKLVGGVHDAINAAGHNLYLLDNVWVSTDDDIVQAIIDSYEPLLVIRSDAKARLIEQFEEATKELENLYPEIEKRTFIKQENEARAFLLDNTTITPTLTPIATARDITVLEVVNRVILKADEYTLEAATLIGTRQCKEDLIDSENDWEVISSINLLDD